MPDVFSPEKRSEIMSRIQSKNTQAEMIVFRYLLKRKIYFQKHYTRVAGKPDIALPRKKRAVFVDGDFWHGRDYDRIVASRPEGDYWPAKIAYNMERDTRSRTELLEKGWQILAVWESDIKRKRTRNSTLERIANFLTDK